MHESFFNLRTNFIQAECPSVFAIFSKKNEGTLRHDEGLAVLALFQSEDHITKFFAQVGPTLPTPVAAFTFARVLAVFTREIAKISASLDLAYDVAPFHSKGSIGIIGRAGNLDEAEMNAVFLNEAILVFFLVGFDFYWANRAGGFGLLLAHVAVNHIFFLFLAVVFLRNSAGAEVGEEFAANGTYGTKLVILALKPLISGEV